jgi:hypothetical protein
MFTYTHTHTHTHTELFFMSYERIDEMYIEARLPVDEAPALTGL